MKTLSTDAAAVALGIGRKTLDNILAREARSMILTGSRGRRRQIPIGLLELIAIAMILNRDLGVNVSKGLELAQRIVATSAPSVPIGSLSAITFDLTRLRRALDLSIADALESVAEPTRGRPKG